MMCNIDCFQKKDKSQSAVQYYYKSGFHEIVVSALSDPDSAVRAAALESLKVYFY